MEISKTDVQNLIRILNKSAELIDQYCKKPCELDKARQLRRISKKLIKKISTQYHMLRVSILKVIVKLNYIKLKIKTF